MQKLESVMRRIQNGESTIDAIQRSIMRNTKSVNVIATSNIRRNVLPSKSSTIGITGRPVWNMTERNGRRNAMATYESQKEALKRYRLKHPEKMREASAKYRLLHPDRVKATNEKYKLNNEEKLKQRAEAYRNSPEGKEKRRIYAKTYQQKRRGDPIEAEKIKEYARIWQHENLLKTCEYQRRWRAKKKLEAEA
jgi:hypothetical protein